MKYKPTSGTYECYNFSSLLREEISTKTTKDGLLPEYMRVTIGGDRFEISKKRYVHPDQWSLESGRVKGNTEEAKSVNKLIESLRAKAYDEQKQILQEGKGLTVETFRNKWLGLATERPRMLMEIFEHHNKQMGELVNQEFSPLTMQRYVTSKNHTLEFLRWKFQVDDIIHLIL